jgi:hypothetical protein
LFRQGGEVSQRLKPPALGREKTAMATAVTSATWRNHACRRRNDHHFVHGCANIECRKWTHAVWGSRAKLTVEVRKDPIEEFVVFLWSSSFCSLHGCQLRCQNLLVDPPIAAGVSSTPRLV